MSTNGTKRPLEQANDEASRPRKRPGGASRISKAESEAVLQRQQQRNEETRKAASSRGVEEVVRQHYNAVPQRGREWRKTDSRIKGLRSFNNWVKSTLIHKFSPTESGSDGGLRVLDIGCGKGGDLGKWQQAPQPLDCYVGVDPAEVSIEQARERYAQMKSGGGRGGRGRGRGGYSNGRQQQSFHAEFFVDDAFSNSLGDNPLIQEIGFGPGSRWGPGGGFDVVSMMFCMHYAFESEAKAKGMLQNVASSLKKGGRFVGVIPNSDVIRSGVQAFHERQAKEVTQIVPKSEPNGMNGDENEGLKSPPYLIGKEPTPPFAPQSPPYIISEQPHPSPIDKQSNDEREPKSKSPAPDVTPALNVLTEPTSAAKEHATNTKENDEPKPEPASKITTDHAPPPPPVAEWGNDIYHIRFPGQTPKDGVFRPPYGWKYSFFMEEAVEEVPEYVVPWEAFRAIAEDYNLELQYRQSFAEIWKEEKNHRVFGPLSERMGVRARDGGPLLVTDEEMEAASFYHAFCFYKI